PPLLVAPDTSPSRPVRAGWRHARACRPPALLLLWAAPPHTQGHATPGPPPFPICADGGSTRGHAAPGPPLLPWTAPPRTRGMEAREGTRPSIPIAPGPSPLGHAARTRGNGAPERTRHPSCGRGVQGTTPLAAPYARGLRPRLPSCPRHPVRAERGHARASRPIPWRPVRARRGSRGVSHSRAGALTVRSRSPRPHPVFA
ncbi:hypothetical protein EDB85DRAFT_1943898, partial [Lactarius pseudohatsudake]